MNYPLVLHHKQKESIGDHHSCAHLPVEIKNAQAVYYRGELCIGGGYTGHSKTDTVIYACNSSFTQWRPLGENCPLKWFSLAVFDGQLLAIGGKVSGSRKEDSNKIVSWEEEMKEWLLSFPPMLTTRASPVTFSWRSYLVVAGGRKGVLDYNVEVFSAEERQWSFAGPLPLPCSIQTSLVLDDKWYLHVQSECEECADLSH